MTYNTIPAASRKTSIEALQPMLASSLYLARVAKHAHWNVVGPTFISTHRLLDEVYEAAEDWADDLAERIRGLSGTAEGMPDEMIENSHIGFAKAGVKPTTYYIEMVAEGLGILSKMFRDKVNPLNKDDPATSNMLQDLSGKADHFIYLLESHCHG